MLGLNDVGGVCVDADVVEWRLAKLGVVQTLLQDDPLSASASRQTQSEYTNLSNGMSRFGGGMATLATQRDADDSDYDDVD